MQQRQQKTFYGKRACVFCKKKIDFIDYRDGTFLHRYLSMWAKMKPAQNTGTCSRHQRRLAEAIKRARFLAILPYVKR